MDRSIDQLTSHVSSCDRDKVHAQEWRRDATGALNEIRSTLRDLVTARAKDAGVKQGQLATVHLIWVGVIAGASVIGWALDHFKVLHS